VENLHIAHSVSYNCEQPNNAHEPRIIGEKRIGKKNYESTNQLQLLTLWK